jgi:hypothetical protein
LNYSGECGTADTRPPQKCHWRRLQNAIRPLPLARPNAEHAGPTSNLLILLARPTRFERVTFAFGG